MAAIWVVSEESEFAATLAHHVAELGEVWLGQPDRSAFKDAKSPDLLILCAVTEVSDRHDALERLLGFVRQIPHARRVAPPVLYLSSDAVGDAGARLERLFDDRGFALLRFPLDPDDLTARARELLRSSAWPESLRERARKLWVAREVERAYAGVDLPALRQAVDPRNAHRPVLLVGEAGTRRGLLARYIHNLAEPARDAFVPISLAAAAADELEREIMTRTASRRSTAFLDQLDRAPLERQEQLAELLGASGALALEPLRWIGAASRTGALTRALRDLAWLVVELPPLRARSDTRELIDASFRAAAERQAREIVLDDDARERLLEYGWPGNLRELDRVAEASCAAAAGPRISAAELRIATRMVSPPTRQPQPSPPPFSSPAQPPFAAPEPAPSSDEDLMLATLQPRGLERSESIELPPPEPEPESEFAAEPEFDVEPEPESDPEPRPAGAAAVAPGLSAREIVLPLAHAIRAPLRAFRTYANLVEQRPDDEHVRRELRTLVEQDLGGLEETLQRVERFARLGPPVARAFDLAAALAAELDARQNQARAKALVVLRELDAQAPPLLGDENQIRLAVRSLLDLALRLVPQGGDLYLGSAWRSKGEGVSGGHRILLRFHSPEDVLTGPVGGPEGDLLEVVIARDLFERARGSFAIDASGAQDNVILVELPG